MTRNKKKQDICVSARIFHHFILYLKFILHPKFILNDIFHIVYRMKIKTIAATCKPTKLLLILFSFLFLSIILYMDIYICYGFLFTRKLLFSDLFLFTYCLN